MDYAQADLGGGYSIISGKTLALLEYLLTKHGSKISNLVLFHFCILETVFCIRSLILLTSDLYDRIYACMM